MTVPFDEDAQIREDLAAMGPDALRELKDLLTWPQPRRDEFLHSLVGRPDHEPLAQLIAIADTVEVARLRLLRALRDLEPSRPSAGAVSPVCRSSACPNRRRRVGNPA